ncbi:MAG: class I SAM-dependent methyltransferase [Candidatus Magasanikbacteria bacterium]
MTIEKERLSVDTFIPPWVRHEHEARFEFASRFVKDKIVVDCACGSGLGSTIFAQAGARQVLAYDISADDIARARQKNNLPNLVFAVGDATSLPCADQSAEVFISLETIEHLFADDKYLSEVRRVLKPDGVFICSTPNRSVTGPGTTIIDHPANKYHVREYSQEEFVDRLKKYFLSIEMFRQNPQANIKFQIINFIAKYFSAKSAVRFGQFLKLPRLIFDRSSDHAVVSQKSGQEYEYLVAVCRI